MLASCLLLSLLAAGCSTERGKPTQDKDRKKTTSARKAESRKHLTLDLGNGVTMKLAPVPAGKFLMGSGVSAEQLVRQYRGTKGAYFTGEFPQREVTISNPFYMGVTEVTQSQWRAVMGSEPWKGEKDIKEGDENAASYVSWDDTTTFCAKLSQKTGRTIRLPTEAEWEYACRAGNRTRYGFGDDESKLGDYAWSLNNAANIGEEYAHPVRQKKPNAWGLYDMHGNVSEWCGDWYDKAYYAAGGNTVDPTGPASGTFRVLRGGSFISNVWNCRSASRYRDTPGSWIKDQGFRVAVEPGSGVGGPIE